MELQGFRYVSTRFVGARILDLHDGYRGDVFLSFRVHAITLPLKESKMLFDRSKDYEFISQVYELDPGEIYEIVTYLFEFSGVEMPHDTYHGVKVNLRSLKLGLVPGQTSLSGLPQAFVFSLGNSSDASGLSWIDKRSRQGKESPILTRSCLACLSANGGTSWAFLRRLHLHNIERMDSMALGAALSSCPSLLDFEIAGLESWLRSTSIWSLQEESFRFEIHRFQVRVEGENLQ